MASGSELLAELAGSTSSITRSSFNVSFIVVSDIELVEKVPVLPAQHLEELQARLDAALDALEAERAVLLADFEGEFTGHGGELVTAALLPTCCIDRESLAREDPRKFLPASAGVLLDMRSEIGRRLARRVMESSALLKVIWGADGDLRSLRHQDHPFALGFDPCLVVDAQLAFSTERRRLGMARMLERVPAQLVDRLPEKGCIDFDTPHSRHRRALRWPLSVDQAQYAVDDLHRLEAIVRSQAPLAGTYADALEVTDKVQARIAADPDGLVWLEKEFSYFEGYRGLRRRAKAVQFARHIQLLRNRESTLGDHSSFVCSLESKVKEELGRHGVVIPVDLAFAG